MVTGDTARVVDGFVSRESYILRRVGDIISEVVL